MLATIKFNECMHRIVLHFPESCKLFGYFVLLLVFALENRKQIGYNVMVYARESTQMLSYSEGSAYLSTMRGIDLHERIQQEEASQRA